MGRFHILIAWRQTCNGGEMAQDVAKNKEIEEAFFRLFGIEISGWLAPDMITISGKRELIEEVIRECLKKSV